MSFLCKKTITLGKKTYNPGDVIPETAVLSSRKRALMANGYIAEMKADTGAVVSDGATAFTQADIDAEVAKAVEKLQKELDAVRQNIAEQSDSDSVVNITVKANDDETVEIALKQEEIQKVFEILQMNADEGVKEIANVQNEDVLILVHAVDNRQSVKKAAEKQAGLLTSIEEEKDDAKGSKQSTKE